MFLSFLTIPLDIISSLIRSIEAIASYLNDIKNSIVDQSNSTATMWANISNSNKDIPIVDWLTAIGTLSSAFIALGIALHSSKISKQSERKQGLRYVFQLLDNNAHRNARRRIVNVYGEDDDSRIHRILTLMGLKEEDLTRKYAIIKESEEIVKADFDQIGALITNNEIPEKDFIKIYWHEVLRCWMILEKKIFEIREYLDDDFYMKNFENLKILAENYSDNIGLKRDSNLIKKDIIVHIQSKGFDRVNQNEPTMRLIIGHFDEHIDFITLNENTVYIIDANSKKISSCKIETKKINNSKSVEFKIYNIPPDNKKYYIFISKNIKDCNGISLEDDLTIDLY